MDNDYKGIFLFLFFWEIQFGMDTNPVVIYIEFFIFQFCSFLYLRKIAVDRFLYELDSDVIGFREAVHQEYYMWSYFAAENNPRITMVEQQAQMFIVMAYVLLCVLPLVAVVLISTIISRKVKSEQR